MKWNVKFMKQHGHMFRLPYSNGEYNMVTSDDTFWWEYSPRPSNPIIGQTYYRTRRFRWERLLLILMEISIIVSWVYILGVIK